MRNRLVAVSIAVWFVLACGSHTNGQTVQGEIVGTVTDASGLAVPGVDVTVKSQLTGFSRVVITNDLGSYVVSNLEPSTYVVSVSLLGFKKAQSEAVVLEGNRKVRIDMRLEVGEASETVTVTATTPVIETETSRVSHTIGESEIKQLPFRVRESMMFAYMTPGTYNAGDDFVIGGNRVGANEFQIDGISSGDPVQGGKHSEGNSIDPSILTEVRIDRINNSAEFAKAGTLNMGIRGGTNIFHGEFGWSNVTQALKARPFFATERPHGPPTNSLRLTVSGPVVLPGLYDGRNKTFFMFHAMGQELNEIFGRVLSVPTTRMRSGDFSGVGNVRDPLTGQNFPGNAIPASRQSTAAIEFMKLFYPLPSEDFVRPASNLLASVPRNKTDRGLSFRADQKISQKNTIYFRWWQFVQDFKDPESVVFPSGLGGLVFFRNRNGRSGTLSDTHVFSPKAINELRIGYTRIEKPSHSATKAREVVPPMGLIYPEQVNLEQWGFPSVTISGLDSHRARGEARAYQNNYQMADHFTFHASNHGFKTGFDVRYNNDTNFPTNPTGQFGTHTFDGFATGQPFGDFLLGIPRTASRSRPLGPYYGSNTEWSVYFQDDWKVTPRLTLNWGVRYERHNPWREQSDRLFNFDPARGSVVVPSKEVVGMIHPLFPSDIPVLTASDAGYPARSLVGTDTNDIAPRIGFAWRSGLAEIVVRGGYGLFYNFEAQKNFYGRVAGPFVATETFDNSLSSGVPVWSWPRAFPAASARPLATIDTVGMKKDMRSSLVHQWSLTLEKQIGNDGFRTTYAGIKGSQLLLRRNLNQPPPSPTPFSQNRRPWPYLRNVIHSEQGGNQIYHAMELQHTRRFTRGFSWVAHYTWAKNLTDVEDTARIGGTIEDAFDRRREWGNEGYTRRHRFASYGVWELPLGRGRRYLAGANRVLNGFVGDWTFSPLIEAMSGWWLTPYYTGRDISSTNVTQGRPDRICNGNLSQPSIDRWFDLSCFSIPAAGTGRFGNSGRSIIEGPGNWSTSLGVSKRFPLSEIVGLELKAHISNLFNHPPFFLRAAELNMTAAAAGQVRSSSEDFAGANNRQILLDLRITW